MTAATMLKNAHRAAEWLQWRANGHPPVPPTHVLIEWAASIKNMAATWHMPGEEAQLALDVAAKARRQLAKGKAS